MKTKKNVIIACLSVGAFWFFAPPSVIDKIIGVPTFFSVERQCFNYYKDGYLKDPDSAYLIGNHITSKEDELKLFTKILNQERPENKFSDKEAEPVFFARHPDSIFKKFDSIVVVGVRAKNSYGGYISDTLECGLDGGRFSALAMDSYQSAKRHYENCSEYTYDFISHPENVPENCHKVLKEGI